jgi:hypothetical protein
MGDTFTCRACGLRLRSGDCSERDTSLCPYCAGEKDWDDEDGPVEVEVADAVEVKHTAEWHDGWATHAAIIAAAPELLSALRMARDYLEGIAERNNDEEIDATLRYVDAAIAKAEGR